MARFQALYGSLHLALVADDMAAVAAIADTGVAVARETGMGYLELLVQLHRAMALALLRRREALAACLSELRALVSGTCFEKTCIDVELLAAWDARWRRVNAALAWSGSPRCFDAGGNHPAGTRAWSCSRRVARCASSWRSPCAKASSRPSSCR
jgi:hypothetical protein